MKSSFILGLSLLLASSFAVAEIYKCKIDGRIVYADSKCADNAEKMEIIIEKVDVQNSEQLKKQTQNINKETAPASKKPQVPSSKSKQELSLELEIKELTEQMNLDLEPLQKRKANSGMDRNIKRAMEQKIKAVTEKYQTKIDANQEQLKRLREQNTESTSTSSKENNAEH